MSTLIVPPDSKCNSAYDQIAAIARSHALVVSSTGGVMTIATPQAQRETGLREKVLRMHCMVEAEDGIDLPPTPQWPKAKRVKPSPEKVQDIDLGLFT